MSRKLENKSESKPKRDKHGRLLPGNTANPNGKPKGSFSLIAMLKAELQKCPEGEDKKTYADLLIKRILKSAIQEGNDKQIRLIVQYIEGMPVQKIINDNSNNISDEELDKSIKNAIKQKTIRKGTKKIQK